MVKVKYLIEAVQCSIKSSRMKFTFKRIPTKEQLEEFRNEKKDTKSIQMAHIDAPFPTFMSMGFAYPVPDELVLNFDRVEIAIPYNEEISKKYVSGMVVELNMPESVDDIILANPKS